MLLIYDLFAATKILQHSAFLLCRHNNVLLIPLHYPSKLFPNFAMPYDYALRFSSIKLQHFLAQNFQEHFSKHFKKRF